MMSSGVRAITSEAEGPLMWVDAAKVSKRFCARAIWAGVFDRLLAGVDLLLCAAAASRPWTSTIALLTLSVVPERARRLL